MYKYPGIHLEHKEINICDPQWAPKAKVTGIHACTLFVCSYSIAKSSLSWPLSIWHSLATMRKRGRLAM